MRSLNEILKNTKYNEHNVELFLTECYADFIYFAENCFGFQIANYHREWFDLVERYNRMCVIAFRGSGKTSFFAAYFIWKAIFSENKHFLIVSSSLDQSKLVLKLIRDMIMDNELLNQFAPQSRELTWKATELNLKTGGWFICRTYGENVRGLRIDYLLCDEAQQYEDKSIFWKAIQPVVELNMGRVIVTGTPKTHIDLLAELFENDQYFCRKYPAEVNNKPLWPQRYTTALGDLEDKRSLRLIEKGMGELYYMQEYLLIPISSANSIFPIEMIMKSIDNSKGFLTYGKSDDKYYVGVDLAITQSGDYTVYTVIKSNNDGKELVYAERFRDSFEEQKRKLKQIFDMFRPVKICIDKTGCGEQIFRDLAEIIPGIEPVHFTYEEKYKLIMDLRLEFEKFRLRLPNSKEDLKCYGFTQELIKELSDFILKVDLENRTKTKTKFGSGRYDDCVISLALANRASQNSFGTVSIRAL
jgi:hypothetical protein